MVRSILARLGLLALALLAGCSPEPVSSPPTPSPAARAYGQTPVVGTDASVAAGTVIDAGGSPIYAATVRVQATANATQTDEAGRFTLAALEEGVPVTISAWAEGYYCANAVDVTPPAEGITLVLRSVQTTDNPAYDWISPLGEGSCYSCKPGLTQVWLDSDAHGRSAANPRFLTMYNGTDVSGNQSPLTRFGFSRDYGRFPLRPDPEQPYFGPGYRLDFPFTAGNCAACHVPAPAIDAPDGV